MYLLYFPIGDLILELYTLFRLFFTPYVCASYGTIPSITCIIVVDGRNILTGVPSSYVSFNENHKDYQ